MTVKDIHWDLFQSSVHVFNMRTAHDIFMQQFILILVANIQCHPRIDTAGSSLTFVMGDQGYQ